MVVSRILQLNMPAPDAKVFDRAKKYIPQAPLTWFQMRVQARGHPAPATNYRIKALAPSGSPLRGILLSFVVSTMVIVVEITP